MLTILKIKKYFDTVAMVLWMIVAMLWVSGEPIGPFSGALAATFTAVYFFKEVNNSKV